MTNPEKAFIEVAEQQGKAAGTKVNFFFNPETISYTKSVKFKEDPRPSTDAGDLSIVGGIGGKFAISKALFDTTLPASGKGSGTGENVRNETDKLLSLMEVDHDLAPIRPPKCRFVWGSFRSFEVYLESVALTFDFFSPSGVPMRAWADITFRQADDGRLPAQNPTSGSYARKLWTVLEGETLDWIAYQEYGDPGAWRHIAEVNNLANPMRLQPGQLLKLTPLE
jgi:nucleoid-associated protein YgaU